MKAASPIFRSTIIRLLPYEIITLVYLLLTAVLALITRVSHWQDILLLHGGLIALIFLFSSLPTEKYKLLQFLRDWYLIMSFPFVFKELTYLSTALFPYYLEPLFIQSDLLLDALILEPIGFQPTFWLNEFMAFAYWTYYPLVPLVGFILYAKAPRSEFLRYMFRLCATFLICYVLYILMPVRGPHHAMLNHNPADLDGGLFLSLVLLIQGKGQTVGAAFPSSHVAAAWICVFALRQIDKRWYIILTLLVSVLSVSVFYLRYHYMVDAIAGFVLALGLQRLYEAIEAKMVRRQTVVPADAEYKLVAD